MSLIQQESHLRTSREEKDITTDNAIYYGVNLNQTSADLQESRQTRIIFADRNSSDSSRSSPPRKATARQQVLSPMIIDTNLTAVNNSNNNASLHLNNSNDAQLISPNQHHPITWQTIPSLIMTPVADHVGEDSNFLEIYPFNDDDNHHRRDDTKTDPAKSLQQQQHQQQHRHSLTDQNSNNTIQSLDISAPLQEVDNDDAALRSRIVRSTTIISTTSSGGRPRLTQRLSYLAQFEDLTTEKRVEPIDSRAVLPNNSRRDQNRVIAPAPVPAPKNRLLCPTEHLPSGINETRRFNEMKAAAKKTTLPPVHSIQRPSISQNKVRSTVIIPPIPKLYKRLLKLFKLPYETFDSGPMFDVAPAANNKHGRARGQSDIPARPNSSDPERYKDFVSKQSSEESIVLTIPPLISLPAAADSAHRPPESRGFRARFLKKLMSSPNLNAVVHPIVAPVSAPALVHKGIVTDQQQQRQYCSQCHEEEAPLSPLTSEYEHEHSCPAGQRIQERRNGRPRANTMPRDGSRMPTLQSKYGVPSRELGAGTQAQVMLLRVKSSKRMKNSQFYTPKSKQVKPLQHQGAILSTDENNSADSLLSPHSRSGTLLTTNEDEVTPEQREAYRKRLLRRSSTAGYSIGDGGLIYAIKKFRPPKATETHRQYLKKVCAEFCISTSLDHENIIRTIDLVRDQPGQERFDDDVVGKQKQQKYEEKNYQKHGTSSQQYGRDFLDVPVDSQGFKDDYRDCNCPQEHRRRVRAIKSADELRYNSSNQGPLSSTSPAHQSTDRSSAISHPHRRRSMDTLSNQKNILGDYEHPHQHHHHHHRHYQQGDRSNQSESQMMAAAKKRKQQQEQELRQKEVQRLKQQKQREKEHAKQLRLDQFPEYCMVMEFAAGGDLFNLLTKSHPPISLNEKHCLWRQLVNGVQYMHSMGVAHRDLKPENILIDATGRILKITDFGIANVFKSVGDPIPLPCSGIIGSAPEEFYQEEYDPRAVDVWACGIIFYVMFYSAMPWARADRKKDARFARYINDIMNHRRNEPQRRIQYERRQLLSNSIGSGSVNPLNSLISGSETFSRPHEASHLRQFPPYQPAEYGNSSNTPSSVGSGPLCSSQGRKDSKGPNSSVECSTASPAKGSPDKVESITTSTASAASIPPTVYNTYSYNGYIGGHEFLDRIETPGCRRIMYAILEPDAKKRVTIDQVVNDEWVSRIRYCTDCPMKQDQMATAMFGQGTSSSRYLQLPSGELHHRHATPKKVKS
ncbi:serine/threonine-protein kinase HAL4/sat4 [Entomortierella lignicola]|nr:serine/threonine-protein kinase HAL4/sat4 [Entomortierella lignicola]